MERNWNLGQTRILWRHIEFRVRLDSGEYGDTCPYSFRWYRKINHKPKSSSRPKNKTKHAFQSNVHLSKIRLRLLCLCPVKIWTWSFLAIQLLSLFKPAWNSAGVYPIFYYPSSIGTRGEGYRGHGTSRSVVGTAHPDPWQARHTPRSESLKLNLGIRHWMQVKALESLSRSWNGTPLTLSGTFVNAHTHRHTHMRVSIVYSITHIFWLSVGHI